MVNHLNKHVERDQQQAGHEARHEQGLPAGVAQDEPDPLQEESVPDLVEDEEVKSSLWNARHLDAPH